MHGVQVRMDETQVNEASELRQQLQQEFELLSAYQSKTRAQLEAQLQRERVDLEQRVSLRRAAIEQQVRLRLEIVCLPKSGSSYTTARKVKIKVKLKFSHTHN